MVLALRILLAAVLLATVSARRTYNPKCDTKYSSITKDHTMCIAEADVGTDVPLDQATKDVIVHFHNDARARVDPPATNMNKLSWDEELALVAGKWARQCKRWGAHDEPYQKMMPGLAFVTVGQNAARFVDNETWSYALNSWYREVQFYQYGSKIPTDPDEQVGHYTQLVAATSQRIGCARAFCPNDPRGFQHNFICNYAPWGNLFSHPYKSGEQGSACLHNTTNGLCDCCHKVCQNGGTLNTASCTCSCRDVFAGDKCEKVGRCPKQDPWNWCQTLNRAQCPMGTRYRCPLRCQICPPPCNGKKCVNGGVMNWDTCQCACQPSYTGDSCETLNCPKADTHWLCSRWGPSKCGYIINHVILRYRCPVLCGLCPKK